MKTSSILNCLSCSIILIFCSIQNLWGIINVYVYSYLKQYDASLQLNDMNQIFFWYIFASNTGIQFGLVCAYHIGFRQTIILSGLLAAVSILVSSFTKTLLTFTLTFAISNLFFTGLIYLIAIDRAFKLFPNHTELISGICNAIYGVGLLAFGELAFLLINPDNSDVVVDQDFYPESVSNKLPPALRILAAIYGGLAILAFLLYNKQSFIDTPADVKASVVGGVEHLEHMDIPISSDDDDESIPESTLLPLSDKAQTDQRLLAQTPNSNNSSCVLKFSHECSSMKQAILSLPFITTFILVFLVGSFGTMIIGNNKPYGQLHISDDSFLTLVGTVSGLLNGLSGIVWGPIQAKIHFKYNIYAILVINTVCAFLYPSLSDSKPLYFLLTASSVFCYGGLFTVFPIVVVAIFGKNYGTRMLGIFYQGLTVASLFSYLLLEYVSNWTVVFYVYGGLSAFGLLFAIICPKKAKWIVSTDLREQNKDQ